MTSISIKTPGYSTWLSRQAVAYNNSRAGGVVKRPVSEGCEDCHREKLVTVPVSSVKGSRVSITDVVSLCTTQHKTHHVNTAAA